jgi:hypothetical protein
LANPPSAASGASSYLGLGVALLSLLLYVTDGVAWVTALIGDANE